VVEKLGIVGRSARGLVFGGVGFSWPTPRSPSTPIRQGLDGTLRQFAQTPAGPWLLVVVAVTYAVYSFCEARWRRVQPG
jgi:hypothetical protein